MIRAAAGDNRNRGGFLQHRNRLIVNALSERVDKDRRLLEYLLLHKEVVSALLCGLDVPVDGLNLALNGIPRRVAENADALRHQIRIIVILEEENLLSMLKYGGHIRRCKEFFVADAQNQRAEALYRNKPRKSADENQKRK